MKVQDTSAKVFFPNLDGLRTIAFLLVYIQHGLWNSFYKVDISSGFLNQLIYGVANGATGVSVFFVLSGFLITYLLMVEKETMGKIHLWYFYIRRVLRIWPLYFAVVIFALVLYPYLKSLLGIESDLASRPIYYFTFLSNFDVINIQRYHPGADAAIITITWSVAIEEQFYLIWPLLFLFTPKHYYKSVFLLIIGISLVFRFLNKDDGNVLYFHSLSVCADLAVGGLFAYFSLFSTVFKRFFNDLNKIVIKAVYLLGFMWMMYGGDLMNSYTFPIFYRLMNTLFFGFIIIEQNFSANSFYKFSQSKILSYWGKYTYGLYMLHVVALLILDIGFRIIDVPYKNSFLSHFAVGLVGLGISLLMAYFSYEYFEKRFLTLKHKFSFVTKQPKVLEPTETKRLQEKEFISDKAV